MRCNLIISLANLTLSYDELVCCGTLVEKHLMNLNLRVKTLNGGDMTCVSLCFKSLRTGLWQRAKHIITDMFRYRLILLFLGVLLILRRTEYIGHLKKGSGLDFMNN